MGSKDGVRSCLLPERSRHPLPEGKRQDLTPSCDPILCVAAHELLVASRETRRLIRAHAPSWNLQRQAQKDGMHTLRQDAIYKLLAGLTPPDALRGMPDF